MGDVDGRARIRATSGPEGGGGDCPGDAAMAYRKNWWRSAGICSIPRSARCRRLRRGKAEVENKRFAKSVPKRTVSLSQW